MSQSWQCPASPISLSDAFVSSRADDHDSRGQVALLLSLHRQFQGLDARIIAAEPLANQFHGRLLEYLGDPFALGGPEITRLGARGEERDVSFL